MYAIVDPEYASVPAASIQAEMKRFVDMGTEGIDLRSMGVGDVALESVLSMLRQRYSNC